MRLKSRRRGYNGTQSAFADFNGDGTAAEEARRAVTVEVVLCTRR